MSAFYIFQEELLEAERHREREGQEENRKDGPARYFKFGTGKCDLCYGVDVMMVNNSSSV